MRIYEDHNGIAVNAISTENDVDVEGHNYQVLHGTTQSNIHFQHGTVTDNGLNGVTNEALLSILLHRLHYLNDKFPCVENLLAIDHINNALCHLEKRTQSRIERGVEGVNVE